MQSRWQHQHFGGRPPWDHGYQSDVLHGTRERRELRSGKKTPDLCKNLRARWCRDCWRGRCWCCSPPEHFCLLQRCRLRSSHPRHRCHQRSHACVYQKIPWQTQRRAGFEAQGPRERRKLRHGHPHQDLRKNLRPRRRSTGRRGRSCSYWPSCTRAIDAINNAIGGAIGKHPGRHGDVLASRLEALRTKFSVDPFESII